MPISGSPEKRLSDLPSAEDDDHEFKSSATSTTELGKKIARAVSGFANSGGGYFVAGVDGQGNADGGLDMTVGRQDIRDWCDNIVHQVEPTPRYDISLLTDSDGRGNIDSGKCVVLLTIHDSHVPPHMAPDKCYYIRAGAHTVKARHFIVDALFAKRHAQKPRLSHVFRFKPSAGFGRVVQLGVVAVSDSPALEVEISLSPIPKSLETRSGEDYFPIRVPVIDISNPFFMDAESSFSGSKFDDDVALNVKYRDLANNEYVYEAALQIRSSLPAIVLGSEPDVKLVRATESLVSAVKDIGRRIKM